MDDLPAARPAAVLFDVDGTLVDSNYLHVAAWLRAFADAGHPVPAWRVHRAIGRDSDQLLDALLGDAAGDVGDRATDLHGEYYAQAADQLRPLPGARDLLAALHGAGVTVVLATSAPPEELDRLRAVLDSEDVIDAVTDASDVDTAKPAPGIVQVALRRAGTNAAHALFVGDAVWDVRAAVEAGVACVGVRSGGVSAQELLDAGALAVFDDAARVLEAARAAGWL